MKKQDIKKDYINLITKSLDTESYIREILLRHIFQDRLLKSESLLSLLEVKFSK